MERLCYQNHATPEKNATLYKTHKTGMPVRLGMSLTEVMQYPIKNTSHLLDIIDTSNEQPISNHTKLVSLDILNTSSIAV